MDLPPPLEMLAPDFSELISGNLAKAITLNKGGLAMKVDYDVITAGGGLGGAARLSRDAKVNHGPAD